MSHLSFIAQFLPLLAISHYIHVINPGYLGIDDEELVINVFTSHSDWVSRFSNLGFFFLSGEFQAYTEIDK